MNLDWFIHVLLIFLRSGWRALREAGSCSRCRSWKRRRRRRRSGSWWREMKSSSPTPERMPTTWWVAIVIHAKQTSEVLHCCWHETFFLISTGVCLWCRGWTYRNNAGKTTKMMLLGKKYPVFFSIPNHNVLLCFLAAFWLSVFSNTALDSTYTSTGWQRHLHRLGNDADVWHHTHARVQAASCLHPQGAQETQDGSFRWEAICQLQFWTLRTLIFSIMAPLSSVMSSTSSVLWLIMHSDKKLLIYVV